MKIVITGTTSGLGKACKEYFTFHELVELNRPNFDLEVNLNDFVRTDFDVYINNAYSNFKQTELLYKLFEANKDRKCKIINIGSVCADRDYSRFYPYAIHKKSLADACLQLQQVDSVCKIIHLRLGRMDTPLTQNRPNPKMDPSIVAEYIENLLIYMPEDIVIKDFTIDNYFTNSL